MDVSSAIPELRFSEHDVGDQGSLALFLARGESKCGIYWIDFADGASYVGQSVSVRSRLATHRRRWDDASVIRFAECSEERLDELERATIRWVQGKRPLRNKLLTTQPAGPDDLIVHIRPGQSLALPWIRSRRGRLVPDAQFLDPPAPTAGQHAAFLSLQRHAAYKAIAPTLAHLIGETIPSPVETQSILWTVTALPSTNKRAGWRRLITANAGRLEILRIFESKADGKPLAYPSFLNVHPDTSRTDLRGALRRAGANEHCISRHLYSGLTEVITLELPDPETLRRLLQDPVILDAIYALAVSMMRQGMNPLRRFHNWELAADLLARTRPS